MWSGGEYDYPKMQNYLKKLGRPAPGTGGHRITGLTAFVEEEAPALEDQREATSSTFVVDAYEEVTSLVFRNERRYL